MKLETATIKTVLHKTSIELSKKTRVKVIALLNSRLAGVLDLGLQAKQAHWNVKGPNFIALHELFDKVAGEVGGFSDDIAERAVALWGTALGTLEVIAKQSTLGADPLEAGSGPEHVLALAAPLARFAAAARAAIDAADDFGDADTADLFTGISRSVDKLLWFVKAHTQSKA